MIKLTNFFINFNDCLKMIIRNSSDQTFILLNFHLSKTVPSVLRYKETEY